MPCGRICQLTAKNAWHAHLSPFVSRCLPFVSHLSPFVSLCLPLSPLSPLFVSGHFPPKSNIAKNISLSFYDMSKTGIATFRCVSLVKSVSSHGTAFSTHGYKILVIFQPGPPTLPYSYPIPIYIQLYLTSPSLLFWTLTISSSFPSSNPT